MNQIIVAAALPNEVAALCRAWNIGTPSKQAPEISFQANSNARIHILASGVGRKRMRGHLRRYADQPVDCWISFGFAGGLNPELTVGQALTGHLVLDGDGSLVETLKPGGLEESQNLLYCADSVIDSPEKKQDCFSKTRADLVDMESAEVARFSFQRKEPFFWIKGITDAAHETAPADLLNCLDSEGWPSLRKALRYVAFHPSMLLRAIQLGKASQSASKRLSQQLNDAVVNIQLHDRQP